MATIYKRKNVWYIEYFLQGKKTKKSLKTRLKKLAEREKARIENKLEKGNIGLAPLRVNTIDAIEMYSDEINRTKSPPTAKRYAQYLEPFKKFILDNFEALSLKNINRENIENFLSNRETELSAKSYNEVLRLIKKFFDWGMRKQFISINPIIDISRKYYKAPPPRAFTKEEIKLILENASNIKRPIYEFLLYTGLRIGEFSNLEWDDIDLENYQINVKIKDDWNPKTNKNKSVPFIPKGRVEEILKSYSPPYLVVHNGLRTKV